MQDRGGLPRQVCGECGFVFWDNPTPVVAALVEHDDDVLLVRNHGWPDTWFGLVAGFLERGEAPDDGVLREVQEELGLQCEVVELIGNYPFRRMHQVILAYHVRATRGAEVVLGEELAEYKRVTVDTLRPWPMGTGHAVADWLKKRAGE